MSTQTKIQNNMESTPENVDSLTYPVSITQRQFWLIHQLAPDSVAYHIPLGFRIQGNLDILRLEESLNQIIKRHEIFRTTIDTVNGEPVQVVAKKRYVDFTVKDLRPYMESKTEKRAEEIINAEVVRPFDLRRGPLLRATVLRVADDEYIFLTVMHHIITDLHTNDQFADELAAIYNSAINGAPVQLPEPGLQYSDYTVWQQDWIESKEFKSMLAYWNEALEGQSGYLNFLTDKPRPSVLSLRGDAVSFGFSKELTNHLKKFSRQHKVSFFITMLAAYIVLLHRYSGEKHITVGVPHANRRQSEFKDVMGCFINILPISVDFTDNPDCREVLSRVRKAMFGAHWHQEVTFEIMVEELKLKRDLSYNPIYQFGFTFYPPGALELEGLAVEPLKIHNRSSKLDMFAEMWETREAMRALVEYNTDIFDKTTIERFIGNYQKLLESIIEDPEKPVSSLPILTGPEKKQLLQEWNSTKVAYPENSGLHQLFESQVEQTPNSTAIVFENQELTYQELNQRANKIAHYLRKLGVGPEVLVGVFIDRSIEMMVGLLGILKAGGAYVPLDPDFPKQRIAYMIEHSEVLVILTQNKLAMELPETQAKVISLDKKWAEISQESDGTPETGVKPENLAYVMYTSGSTGLPKGVQVHHQAVVNFISSMAHVPGMTAKDVLLAVTTLSFDISILELFLPISVGAKLVIISRDDALDGKKVIEMLDKTKVTVMQATPATWRLLLAAGWEGSDQLKVLCGGEALPKDLVNDLIMRAESVWNMYGPTETTIWSTCYHMTDPAGQILIGRPIANTSIYILDKQMQPVPIGAAGEIYIGGDGVARGYLKDPEKTAKVFVPGSFGKNADMRIYNTGDFGRYLPDGNIECLGRVDNQVKVRGFRIELGEIEFVLSQHPSILQVAVSAKEDAYGGMRLVGYIVSKTGANLSVESLRSFLGDKLPYYMIPDIFVFLKSLPLTPNEKVDRKALPDPEETRPDLDQVFVAPSTDYENALAEIWSEVLKLDRVGTEDNFFDLGGNSLLSVQVMMRVKQTLGVDVSVIKLFQYPTILSLASFLSDSPNDEQGFQKAEKRVAQRRPVQRRAAILSKRKLKSG